MKPLLSFKATPARFGRLFFQVQIFKGVTDLRRYGKQCRNPIRGKVVGACRTFHTSDGYQIGEILLARGQLQVTVVTHECLHAALGWLRSRDLRLTCMAEEEMLCHAQSNLVRVIYRRIFAAGLLVEAKDQDRSWPRRR